jgi:hypothetical protein
MPTIPKYEFMIETWGLDTNPFPADTINTSPAEINEDVFPDEFRAVREKLVGDAIVSRRALGFLWSVPPVPGGEDTGLGKTGTMRKVAWEMNRNWGEGLVSPTLRERLRRQTDAVALYASFDRQKITSLNAVLFQAVVYATDPRNSADGRSIAQGLRSRLAEREGLEPDDVDGVRGVIERTRARLAPGRPALRPELVKALAVADAEDESALANVLASVSDTSRQRNGLDFFEALFTLAQAAGVPHVFVFVDQLEDLANSGVPRLKRMREVERIRDVALENTTFAGKLHLVFTLHGRAQHAVEGFWREARLPRFDHAITTDAYVVTLRGIQTDEQVAELLRTYLRPLRPERHEDITPFDQSALRVLREARDGRVGPILELAQQVFELAASSNRELVDGSFVLAVVNGSELSTDDLAPRRAGAGRDARVIDDVLA